MVFYSTTDQNILHIYTVNSNEIKNIFLYIPHSYFFSSVQFSRSVMFNSLRPHELQHARPPCPSPTPAVHPNSCHIWRRQRQPTPVLLSVSWMEEPGRLRSMGSLRVGHNWATSLSLFTFMHWRRKWQPTPVFIPGESQGWGSLVGWWAAVYGVAQSRTQLKWLSSSSIMSYMCVCVYTYIYIYINPTVLFCTY